MQLSKLEIIEQRIHDSQINLIKFNTKSVKAAAISLGDSVAIFLNENLFDSKVEQSDALFHEWYHIEQNALYYLDSSLQTRKRREYKANKAMIQELVPVEKLLLLINQKYEIFEIAEYFDVTEYTIKIAFKIYKQMAIL